MYGERADIFAMSPTPSGRENQIKMIFRSEVCDSIKPVTPVFATLLKAMQKWLEQRLYFSHHLVISSYNVLTSLF